MDSGILAKRGEFDLNLPIFQWLMGSDRECALESVSGFLVEIYNNRYQILPSNGIM